MVRLLVIAFLFTSVSHANDTAEGNSSQGATNPQAMAGKVIWHNNLCVKVGYKRMGKEESKTYDTIIAPHKAKAGVAAGGCPPKIDYSEVDKEYAKALAKSQDMYVKQGATVVAVCDQVVNGGEKYAKYPVKDISVTVFSQNGKFWLTDNYGFERNQSGNGGFLNIIGACKDTGKFADTPDLLTIDCKFTGHERLESKIVLYKTTNRLTVVGKEGYAMKSLYHDFELQCRK